ncbi:hypothetical protein [Paracoccus thiocyanatus]|uniref:hypothetical protein n=1 Tax=Paracoccus thiocyanatus TaxID=34006 RepID=UPI00122C43BD|nr:hypothetical protein [Paracoccus thiocyanatus]
MERVSQGPVPAIRPFFVILAGKTAHLAPPARIISRKRVDTRAWWIMINALGMIAGMVRFALEGMVFAP